MLRSGKNPRLDLELNALSFIEIQIEIRDLKPIIKELNWMKVSLSFCLIDRSKIIKKTAIGIDISSKTLDICVKNESGEEYFVIANEISAIRKFLKPFTKNNQDIVLGMENTGRYNWNLYEVLENFVGSVFVINPLHLSKSLGLQRGKNDKVDAKGLRSLPSRTRAK